MEPSDEIMKLLDRGDMVVLYKNLFGRYTAAVVTTLAPAIQDEVSGMDDMAETHTDDFTPGKALHRLSEKMLRLGDYQTWNRVLPIDSLLDDDGPGQAELDEHCMAVADRLKANRRKAGFTQEQLADLSQIPLDVIQRLELGQHSPTAKTIKQLAIALDIDPSLLMDGV